MKLPLYILLFAASSSAVLADDLAAILAPLTRSTSTRASVAASAPVRVKVGETELSAALNTALKAHLGLEGDLRLSLTQPWRPPTVPVNTPWEISILQVPSTGLSSTSLVRFRMDCAGERIGEWQVLVRAQLLSPVWAASGRVGQKQPLSTAVCEKVTVDLFREKQAPVPAETDISSYRASQPLSPNQILTWNDIASLQTIRKGQVVEVIASEGAMMITMKGTALTGGGVGEDILVRNLDSHRDISARVVDGSKARVNF